jgi:hypothetical protein
VAIDEQPSTAVSSTIRATTIEGGIPASPRSATRRPRTPRENLERVLHLAGRMLEELDGFRGRFGLPLHLRIGVHCGDVVTGVIGTARPRFCEWRTNHMFFRCTGYFLQ